MICCDGQYKTISSSLEVKVKYDAFISYRHMPLDMEIAKKLHKGLETFPVPAAVQQSSGKKKIERVFRDQEELPIGSNLTEEISAALAESEYLIVVCSHYTPESVWVQREIETFISMHDRSHVLAILIEGEPDESFPKQLIIDDDGNTVEPLAADVRGETKQERNKKFNTELLRLAAPILGCTYDDLKQRHRERMIRRLAIEISALAGAVALAGTMFGIYNASVAKAMQKLANEKAALADEKTALAEDKTRLLDDIMLEYQDKQKNQSKFYASESESLLLDGNRRAAALIAAQGLPSEGNDRPYVPEAEYALSAALRAYNDGKALDFDEILHHDMVVLDVKLCEDLEHLITRDNGQNLHVWSTADWSEVMEVAAEVDESCYTQSPVAYDADADHVYVLNNHDLCAYDYEGNTIWKTDFDVAMAFGGLYSASGLALAGSGNEIGVYSLKDGSMITSFENASELGFTSKIEYDREEQFAIIGHYANETGKGLITIVDSGEWKSIDAELSGGHILQMHITAEKNIAVLSCNGDFTKTIDPGDIRLDLFNKEGERLWSVNTGIKVKNPGTFVTRLVNHYGSEDDESIEDSILIGIENTVYNFRESDGSLIQQVLLPTECVSIMPFKGSAVATVAYDNGDIIPINIITGSIYDLDGYRTLKIIMDAMIAGGRYIIRTRNSPDVNVIGYVKSADLEELPDMPDKLSKYGWCEEGKYYVMGDETFGEYCFYDKDGQMIYQSEAGGAYIKCRGFYGDKTVAATSDSIYIIDPSAKKTDVITLASLGISGTSYSYTITKNGRYLVYYKWNDVGIIDIENLSVIFTYETEEFTGTAVCSEDASKLFISQHSVDLCEIDTATGERMDFMGKRMIQLAGLYDLPSLVVSPDGTLVAMSCMDGQIRIADTKSGTVYETIPLPCSSRIYLEFSPDNKYLIMQGDDYMVKVWGISEREYLGYFQANQSIRYSIIAPGTDRMALVDFYTLYLLDTKEYSRIAQVPDGAIYIPDNESLIMTNKEKVYRCYYKNVDKLFEELERQYPGDSLTTEEKIQYNID